MPLPKVLQNESNSERIALLRAQKEKLDADSLLVHEIYTSLQGEGTHAGVLCDFIRLSVCHLRCTYCDTAHAFHEGKVHTLDDVVAQSQSALVLITGGEPLLQPAVFSLLQKLCDLGREVLLETSGAVSTQKVDPRVRVILDVKTPGSGEHERHLRKNYEHLRSHDEVKFVICNEDDYSFALDECKTHALYEKCSVLFSPEAEGMSARWLADAMVRDRVKARLSLQQHKFIWGQARGV